MNVAANHHVDPNAAGAQRLNVSPEEFDAMLTEWEHAAELLAQREATCQRYAALIEGNLKRVHAFMRRLQGPIAAAVEGSCTLSEFLADRARQAQLAGAGYGAVNVSPADGADVGALDPADPAVAARLMAVFHGVEKPGVAAKPDATVAGTAAQPRSALKNSSPSDQCATGGDDGRVGVLTDTHEDARVRFSRTLDTDAIVALLPCLHAWLAASVAAGHGAGTTTGRGGGGEVPSAALLAPGWTAHEHVAIPAAILDAAAGLPPDHFLARRALRPALRNVTVDLHDVADDCDHAPSAACAATSLRASVPVPGSDTA
eukprot:CAMPEP_0174845710 /NCGR_PEP_ID=MMETSP1114-20130205/11886_1 /TAXON_ID=312471 /ORGANISM="Neobodo designis, Strain CCAP 1951/1" /LENGTH=315 /DNA_ID=CAMNT_0016079965 /DNA_START=65 /DNA_END=1010 /DNA_ORIENTATION=-